MLFDLRGRGRRRTVQVIYLGLALIFLVGFVGFGVGGVGGGGGLLNFLSEEKETGGSSFASQIAAQRKLLEKNPNDAAAWAALVSAQLHEAGNEVYVERSGGKFTSKGKELLGEISNSWSRYLALQSNPSPELAQRMLTVFSEEGLNQPAQAVQALQIVIPTKPPSAALYGQLAEYAYRAKNTREGDLAAEKAVALAPAGERTRIKQELEEIKKNPTGSSSAASAAASASSGAATGAASAGSGTVKIGGKTYPIHTGSTKKKK